MICTLLRKFQSFMWRMDTSHPLVIFICILMSSSLIFHCMTSHMYYAKFVLLELCQIRKLLIVGYLLFISMIKHNYFIYDQGVKESGAILWLLMSHFGKFLSVVLYLYLICKYASTECCCANKTILNVWTIVSALNSI